MKEMSWLTIISMVNALALRTIVFDVFERLKNAYNAELEWYVMTTKVGTQNNGTILIVYFK